MTAAILFRGQSYCVYTVSTLISRITCNIVISGGCGQITRGWFFSIRCSSSLSPLYSSPNSPTMV